MNRVARNPGCQHDCHLVYGADFVIEGGCPVHDRPGYRPFKVAWFCAVPVLVGQFALVADDGGQILIASFVMGLN